MADPWFKLTTAERRAVDRATHQFADGIGGDASNYRTDGGANIKMRHTNIMSENPIKDATTFTGKLQSPQLDHQITFHGGDPSRVFLTLTTDGKLVPGPGLSMDEATQKAAQMLAVHYGAAIVKIRGGI